MKRVSWGTIATVVGVVAIFVYLMLAFGIAPVSDRLVLILAFAIGPAIMAAMLELYAGLAPKHDGRLLRTATVFLVLGFATLTAMIVVQQAIFIGADASFYVDSELPAEETRRYVFMGLNMVQLGLDVTFDIFYSVGLILLGVIVYRSPEGGKILGGVAVVLATALLALNMWTFPIPPSEAGLVDLGPATAIWWLVFILSNRRRKSAPAAA
jgi:hypothetical protein